MKSYQFEQSTGMVLKYYSIDNTAKVDRITVKEMFEELCNTSIENIEFIS